MIRKHKRVDGIFGELFNEDHSFTLQTLEHAYSGYESTQITYAPKIPEGVYLCQRGLHRLEHMDHDFETFEVMNVKGHDQLLFHWGNQDRDSHGCILLGGSLKDSSSHSWMILDSMVAFKRFMDLQKGCTEFTLEISSP